MTTRIIKGPYVPPITRQTIEFREQLILSPFAARSANSLGRLVPTTRKDMRTAFARDCDRILHANSFEALAGKTQMISFPRSPHIHTRRFHTDKVASVACQIARYLGLNEDLTKAIAMGHDLGHTPFGHDGEKALSAISLRVLSKPFRHNQHSLRVVDTLESLEEKGLNLTFEVRDGIIRHCGETLDPVLTPDKPPLDLINLDDHGFPRTLEGCVVRISDQIAYLPHDYRDALREKIVTENDLPQVVKDVFGTTFGRMIYVMVNDVIETCRGKNYITMSDRVMEAREAMFHFEMDRIIGSEKIQAARRKSNIPEIIETLFADYIEKRGMDPQSAIDKIASFTDTQARDRYRRIKGGMDVEQLMSNLERSRVLNSLHEALDGSTDLSDLYRKTIESLTDIFAPAALRSRSILLFDEERGGLRIVESRGIRKDTVENRTIEPDEGIAGKVFASGTPILIKDASSAPITERRGSLMCVPIKTTDGESFGAMTIRSDQANAFEDSDLETFSRIARSLASHVAKTREAVLDGKTGLFKDTKGIERLKKLRELALSRNIPLSFIAFDIDHFKHTNDNYGHLAGDKVIEEIAQAARKIIQKRRESIGIRLGGEEFGLALLGTNKAQAAQIAEELRQEIERMQFSFENISTKAVEIFIKTISLGVAELKPEQSVDDLLKTADSAMYQSKNGGRNRVTAAKNE